MRKVYYMIISCLVILSVSCKQKPYETEVAEIVKSTNINLPSMVDSETRFDSVSSETGRVYQYNYTLIKVEKNGFNTESFTDLQRPKILEVIKKMKNEYGFSFFAKNNVTFSCSYNDRYGNNLVKISILPIDYN